MGRGSARGRKVVVVESPIRSVLLAHSHPGEPGSENDIKQAVEALEGNPLLLDLLARTIPSAITAASNAQLADLASEVDVAYKDCAKELNEFYDIVDLIDYATITPLPEAVQRLENVENDLLDYPVFVKQASDLLDNLGQTQADITALSKRLLGLSSTLASRESVVGVYERRLSATSYALSNERLSRKSRLLFKKRTSSNTSRDTLSALVFGLLGVPDDLLLEDVPLASTSSGKRIVLSEELLEPSRNTRRDITTVGQLRSAMADGCWFKGRAGKLWEMAEVTYFESGRTSNLPWDSIRLDMPQLAKAVTAHLQDPSRTY